MYCGRVTNKIHKMEIVKEEGKKEGGAKTKNLTVYSGLKCSKLTEDVH